MNNPADKTAAAMSQGVVAVIQRGHRLLVIRRSQSVVAPGAFCFPGGAMESGESEQDAVARECLEELNVHVEPVRRIWRSVTSWKVSLGWWQVELQSPDAIRPDPQEVESVHWLTIGQLKTMTELLESNHEFIAAWEAGQTQLPSSGGYV